MLIAQLSDLHVGPPGRLNQRIVDTNRMLRDAIDPIHGLDRAPAPTPF